MNLFLCHRAMGGREAGPSPALLAAQRRLEQLREKHSPAASVPAVSCQSPTTRHPSTSSGQALPPASSPQSPTPNPQLIPLFPDLALGMLREELTAAGRIWLLSRHLDVEGRGWLRLDVLQEKLTGKDSELRVCGRRQLRNLLQQGGGIFWERDRERVWLRSVAKVARALGVERLTGRPVLLPVEALLGGIGQVRAHFYATFHSGRVKANPISRNKLEEITGVPARTQRDYDRAAGVIGQSNIAVGERHNPENVQERAWSHGRGSFRFLDHNGRFGPAGGKYVAWRLPNSYQGPHQIGPMGRKKKINRQIDLVNIGAQGNDLSERTSKVFHTSGLEAGKAYNRDRTADIYWLQSRPGHHTHLYESKLWHVLPAGRKRR